MTVESGFDTLDSILSIEQLRAFRSRVAQHDESKEFSHEDFETLKSSGYLIQAVPEELGGLGLSFAEVCQQQRRLAYWAPAGALAVNTPICWTGVAADLWRSGDSTLEWLLRNACAGEIVATAHGATGNEPPVLDSTCQAERVDGGYCFTGNKNLGTLAPVWSRLGLHGVDDSDPEQPKIIHAFMPRGTPGCEIRETQDAIGMRAIHGRDILLDAAFVPDRYVARVTDEEMQGLDPLVLGISVWEALGSGNVCFGLARFAFDKALASLPERTPVARPQSVARHAEMHRAVADMAAELDAIEAHLERTARDWSNGVEHGTLWIAKTLMTKAHAAEGAWRVIDRACELAGGLSIDHASDWERILRDGRIGRIHPENKALATEVVARSYLGVEFDAQPGWG
jgi:alkylation response protein AidB-like acyl-CoA dehydrogenase